jgi:hypothetical protein
MILSSEGELTQMASMNNLVKQLKIERDRMERQLSGLNAALSAFARAYNGANPTRKGSKMSAEARARISAAQKKRWAKVRAKKGV